MTIVLLLRGINVGKSVQVPMVRLKALLEGLGYTRAQTYLNSGNALIDTDEDPATVRGRVEGALEAEFGQKIPTLAVRGDDVVRIADALPAAWQNDDTQQTYVAYLFPEADRPGLADELPVKRQYLDLVQVPGAVVWHIDRALYNKSQITKIVGHPAYPLMTTRNSNSARKLADLCRERASPSP